MRLSNKLSFPSPRRPFPPVRGGRHINVDPGGRVGLVLYIEKIINSVKSSQSDEFINRKEYTKMLKLDEIHSYLEETLNARRMTD